MRLLFCMLLILASSARADAPPPPAQDPLCASADFFHGSFEKASAVHRKFAQLKPAYDEEKKWFDAVSGEMSASCEDDKKFAAALIARPKADLTGQCKPAEEAASYDQAVLEHSEKRLQTLKASRDRFQKGVKGRFLPLAQLADKDSRLVRDFAYTLREVPFDAFCEVWWTYPKAMLKRFSSVDGCSNPEFDKPAAEDRKSPALFGRMLTRFDQSLSYNTARRNLAAATAKASLARYEACIAQNMDAVPNPKLLSGAKSKGLGQGTAAPAGKSPRKGSDITGTEEDRKKREAK